MQPAPEGLAQAFLIGRDFIGGDRVALALGDNIFYGARFHGLLRRRSRARPTGPRSSPTRCSDPERYGVVEFDAEGKAVGIEEKPKQPKSSFAVTGLYFYDNQVVDIAAALKPSARGELEITDVNRDICSAGSCASRSWVAAWPGSTPAHTNRSCRPPTYVQAIEERQGLMIGCPEEIAYRLGFISAPDLEQLGSTMKGSPYGRYLLRVLEDARQS